MFRVIYRDLFQHHLLTTTTSRVRDPTKKPINLHLKFISSVAESTTNPCSFTVDYLINSCGLSPKEALSAATRVRGVRLSSNEKPDSVVNFLINNGLTKTQISKLISRRPVTLTADIDKVLKPKFEFLHDIGLSCSEIAKAVTMDPILLSIRLDRVIIPSFNFLKSYVGTNENVLIAFKRSTWVLRFDLAKLGEPKLAVLREYGVPEKNISKFVMAHPGALLQNIDRFKKNVERISGMGFDSSRSTFFIAVRALGTMTERNWDKKKMVYKNFGWSEEEVIAIFKKQPTCLTLSEKKIESGVKFFMEKLKWTLGDISQRPTILHHSLDKRIIPRCAVLEILSSKGLLRRKTQVATAFVIAERLFLEKFVTKYVETVPEVIKAYKGEIEFLGFGKLSELKW